MEGKRLKATVSKDDHGTIYTVRCPNCGRDESVRTAGKVSCVCGTILNFRGDEAKPVVLEPVERIDVDMPGGDAA